MKAQGIAQKGGKERKRSQERSRDNERRGNKKTPSRVKTVKGVYAPIDEHGSTVEEVTIRSGEIVTVKTRPKGSMETFAHLEEVVAHGSYPSDELRKTAFGRMVIAIRRMLANAPDDVVHDILHKPTDIDSIIQLISEVGIADVVPISPFAKAYLRGAEMKKKLLEEAGGAYSTGEVAALLGISPQAVHGRLTRKQLLAVFSGNDRNRFPTCQFTGDGVVSGIEEFLAACNVNDPWMQLALLLDPQPALKGKSILEVLPTDQHAMAIQVTKGFAAE